MNNDDVIFVDWIPKKLDVWLKDLATTANFERVRKELISYIKKL
jgi:hypothetical protein